MNERVLLLLSLVHLLPLLLSSSLGLLSLTAGTVSEAVGLFLPLIQQGEESLSCHCSSSMMGLALDLYNDMQKAGKFVIVGAATIWSYMLERQKGKE